MKQRNRFRPGYRVQAGGLAACLLLAGLTATGEPWPSYRHDNRRSGITSEKLTVPMRQAWVKTSPIPPQTAWTAPAKWDAYSANDGLQSMRNFDPAFFVTVVGNNVFYGSSVDHAVHCLDRQTGKERWVYFTGGPVRLPPTWNAGNIYFGSDDGVAYCVEAATGDLVWKHRAAANARLIPSDGKLISQWPVRSGVLVQDGTAYFAGSLLPWEPSYLCAVDAASGDPVYVTAQDGVTLQGAMLASESVLYVPQGRSTPLRFARSDGQRMADVEGSGGVFCILTPDDHLIAGPSSQKPSDDVIRITAPDQKDAVITFPGTNRIIISGDLAYLHQGSQLAAINRTKLQEVQKIENPDPGEVDACFLWKQPHPVPVGYILAGEILFTGTDDRVTAYAADSGRPLWQTTVDGKAYGLVVAEGCLFVSTDKGSIYCFQGEP